MKGAVSAVDTDAGFTNKGNAAGSAINSSHSVGTLGTNLQK